MNENIDLIFYQRKILLDKIKKWVSHGEDYALVDFPDHSNVGDSAIWLGETILLREITGRHPRYVCTCTNYDEEALHKIHPNGPIFLHGGGNFGDIWPKHQIFRERLIRRFKDRLIIQLPQTIHFQHRENAESLAKLVDNRGRVHIISRDQRSYEYATSNFNTSVELAPDAAFALGPLFPHVEPSVDGMFLLRRDREKIKLNESQFPPISRSITDDWIDEAANFAKLKKLSSVARTVAGGRFGVQSIRKTTYQNLASARVARGLRQLAQGRIVVTDRLHAHVLSMLLGLPNIVLDNNYGKIHGYIHTWTKDAHNVHMANSVGNALEYYNAALTFLPISHCTSVPHVTD